VPIAVLVILVAGCSQEQQDWRSAEAADTTEAYGRFLEQHADSELGAQARARIAQLAEDRDWQQAQNLGTMDAYRQFLAQHPNGKWSEEARVRIEVSALGSAPRGTPGTSGRTVARGSSGVNALQLAMAGTPPPIAHGTGSAPAMRLAQAQPPQAPQPVQAGKPAPSATRSAAAGSGQSGYGVQLGAFGSQASADRAWQRLQGRFSSQLGGLSPRIVAGDGESGQLYRLQAPAAGEAQARALCASLKEQSQSCVPVLPH